MSAEESWEQAAVCYRRAGWDLEAARCYVLAGAHRRAAEIYEAAGRFDESAAAYGKAGLPEIGAWLLAHRAADPAQARVMVGRVQVSADYEFVVVIPDGPDPRHRLIRARCEIAEGAPSGVIRPVIADVCDLLADRAARPAPVIEEWAVALSEAAGRYDQAALVFAAAVRGGRYGAAHRWNVWSTRVLDAEVILPPAAA